MRRGAIAETDLNAVSHNLGVIRKITGNIPVIAVVKADAYGHGAVEVSRRLVKEGVYALAVAFTGEAVRLRDAGIGAPIIVLFDKYESGDYFRYNLTPAIHDLHSAKRLFKEARKRGRRLNVHLKVDTGMGRIGFNDRQVLKDIISVARMEFINISGLMSHFSVADLSDKSFAVEQIRRFNAVRDGLRKIVKGPLLCHMANSAATLSFKDAHLDAVRPGLALYGYPPLPSPAATRSALPLRPVMSVKTEILSLRRLRKGTPVSYGGTFVTRRESLIAVLPVGYADGFCRSFSNNADVLVRGKRAPVAGRVCMDLTMVDVTRVAGVKEGDEVVLIGKQRGEAITAWEVSERVGTVPYEILTGIGSRARRVFVGS